MPINWIFELVKFILMGKNKTFSIQSVLHIPLVQKYIFGRAVNFNESICLSPASSFHLPFFFVPNSGQHFIVQCLSLQFGVNCQYVTHIPCCCDEHLMALCVHEIFEHKFVPLSHSRTYMRYLRLPREECNENSFICSKCGRCWLDEMLLKAATIKMTWY